MKWRAFMLALVVGTLSGCSVMDRPSAQRLLEVVSEGVAVGDSPEQVRRTLEEAAIDSVDFESEAPNTAALRADSNQRSVWCPWPNRADSQSIALTNVWTMSAEFDFDEDRQLATWQIRYLMHSGEQRDVMYPGGVVFKGDAE